MIDTPPPPPEPSAPPKQGASPEATVSPDPSDRSEPHAYLRVEREGQDRYRILSSDLEKIGEQLRGKPRFSIFNSIILPLIVTLATIILTSLFQYVSWQNAINLQAASDQAAAASNTYDRATSEAEKRLYATYLFQVAVKNISNKKAYPDTRLYKYESALQKKRCEDFYKQLESRNQTYGQLLPDISYNIDRLVFTKQWTDNGYVITNEVLDKIKCDVNSLTDELESNGLDRFVLAYHFGVINKCFTVTLSKFGAIKELVLANADRAVSNDEFDIANASLYEVRQMLNEFRCYALTRIHYFNALKEKTIFLSHWFTPEQQSVVAHFADTKARCKVIT